VCRLTILVHALKNQSKEQMINPYGIDIVQLLPLRSVCGESLCIGDEQWPNNDWNSQHGKARITALPNSKIIFINGRPLFMRAQIVSSDVRGGDG
jgi:hypothetical protein